MSEKAIKRALEAVARKIISMFKKAHRETATVGIFANNAWLKLLHRAAIMPRKDS